MVKKLIQGVGVTAACLQLALLPAKAADPAVSLTKEENGNNFRADLELTENLKSKDVVSLQLSFEVDKKPSKDDIQFEFNEGIPSQVKTYRYDPEEGRLNIYISGNQKLFESDTLTLGTVVLSDKIENATVHVVKDSFVIVNDAFHMEEVKLPSLSDQEEDNDDNNNDDNNNDNNNDNNTNDNNNSSSGSSGSSGSGGSGGSIRFDYPSSSSTYENRNILSSTEAEAVSTVAGQMFGGVFQIQRVEKTSNGICIISKENDVIFLKNNGDLAKNEWQLCGVDWYYFDADRKAAKGWKVVGGKWYYLNSQSKKMERGWLKSPVSGKWYYLDTVNGDMKSGWQLINNKWYYLDTANGDMKSGWQLINSKWYYLDSINGDMKSGWQLVNGSWYFLDTTNGDMKTGWQQIQNKWYYLDSINGNCFMDTTTPDGYKVNVNGEWIP